MATNSSSPDSFDIIPGEGTLRGRGLGWYLWLFATAVLPAGIGDILSVAPLMFEAMSAKRILGRLIIDKSFVERNSQTACIIS